MSNPYDAPRPQDAQAVVYARELADVYRLQRVYERMLPTALDQRLIGALQPVERQATILFSDVRGFTGISERFADNPAQLLSITNEHLTVVVRAVMRCGGVVEKFVGDGVLATFGARDDLPDSAERAVAAALGVVGANELLNRRRSEAWGFRVEVGIGLDGGKVVLGRVGPSERWELGVLGDSLNVASRLVAKAEPGEVLLSVDVYRRIAAKLSLELMGPLAIRGHVGRIEAYRISLLRSEARRPVKLACHKLAAAAPAKGR